MIAGVALPTHLIHSPAPVKPAVDCDHIVMLSSIPTAESNNEDRDQTMGSATAATTAIHHDQDSFSTSAPRVSAAGEVNRTPIAVGSTALNNHNQS
jgi:hypothetical protein